MPCYSPMVPYVGPLKKNGKMSLVFAKRESWRGETLKIPCGNCIGCRMEFARQWAVRCFHEASLYERNAFITLTYDYEHLPLYETLSLRDFQLFMKRLRKSLGGYSVRSDNKKKWLEGEKIKYFHCGEYGEVCAACGHGQEECLRSCGMWIKKIGRPHYHALIFNYDFPDKKLFKIENGNRLYRSETLERLWPNGISSIGDVSLKSAGYVARYVMKKVTGKLAYSHYGNLDREYISMSRSEGIGKKWYEKFKNDVYPSDEIIIEGKRQKPPKYYDYLLDKENNDFYKELKNKRKLKALENSITYQWSEKGKERIDDNDSKRLGVKEIVKLSQIKNLKRGYENE